jgi:Mg-chelatase subunit ChlD
MTFVSNAKPLFGSGLFRPFVDVPEYDGDAFMGDVAALLKGNAFRPLRDVVGELERQRIAGKSEGALLRARSDALKVGRWMRRVAKSDFIRALKDTFEDSAADAFRAMFQYSDRKTLNRWMRIDYASAKRLLEAMKATALVVEVETGAGTKEGSVQFATSAEEAERVASLLQRLRVEYQRFSTTNSQQKVVETSEPDDIDIVGMRSYAELPRALPTDWYGPREIVALRLATRDFRVRRYVTSEPTPPKHVVMLLDLSASMYARRGGYSALEYAKASALALLEAVEKSGVRVKVVPFTTTAATPFEPMNGSVSATILAARPEHGAGTSIDTALKAVETYNPDEIILITDGDDRVTYKPSCRLTTYHVGTMVGIGTGLENVSTRYVRVDTIE